MSIRRESLLNINPFNSDTRFISNKKDRPISEYFASNVFNQEAIKKYLMKEAYESLMTAIDSGQKIDEKTADFVAVGMRNWAIDNGATHFTHWFQPMTGKTAEKHDSFFKLDRWGNPIEAFSGSELIKQEPDGSSFPNGGLRDTHRARGYTVWDPSSYAFIVESSQGKTLCIPAIFISYEGESLDLKTPLLKSVHTLEKSAIDVCRLFDPSVRKVTVTLGWEQEYFVVDEALYNARPDLVLCGRTLFGNASARGQQLDDHYFAPIPERVHDFMHDFEDDCLMLGIPITTRHNEVAPTQFECAPNFEDVNVAADHNQLLMSMIDKIAKRHKLRALIHEKPYKGINGSGKHNNWSMATDTGVNLLSPGSKPAENLQFLTFLINVVAAMDKHAALMRASIANPGNEHRLGANEAPPAIISIFVGDNLQKVLDKFKKGEVYQDDDEDYIELNLEKIANLERDNTDRNRTSPFPFTGNRFEFRAVGSSVNVSNPMTVLNSIVADQLREFKENVDKRIKKGNDTEKAIKDELVKILKKHERVIFNGDNYSDDWVTEAEKRGLPHIKSSPDAFAEFLKEDNIKLFERVGVFNEREVKARFNVMTEEYISKLDIEARLISEISRTQIIPGCVDYQNKLIKNIQGLNEVGLKANAKPTVKAVKEISDNLNQMTEILDKLESERAKAEAKEDHLKAAKHFSEKVTPLFEKVRERADQLELLIDDKSWPLPKYRELLFLH